LDKRPPATVDPQAGVTVKTSVIESDIYKVILTNDGGVPVSWQMKKFKTNGKGKEEGFVELVNSEGPLNEEFLFGGVPARPRYTVVSESGDKVVYAWRSNDIEIRKIYQFDGARYLMDLTIEVRNLGRQSMAGGIVTKWSAKVPKEEKRGFFGFLKGPENIFQPVYYFNNSVERKPMDDTEGSLLWAGIEDRYFLSAIVPRGFGGNGRLASTMTLQPDGSREIRTKVTTPKFTVLPAQTLEQKFSVYVGPKEMGSLKNAGASLDKAIDYGWFGFIAVPILYLLKFIYGFIHNYGIAIIILTILVKLLLNPLSKHSMKSMKAMQKLQPKLKELKEKYKNDKERLNAETMQLFKTHKVNPMGGCLPMIIQLPIYIALYKVLWNSIELYRAPFFWFYRDLSAADPYFVMPVLLGFFMWLQQKFTPSAAADPAQAKMMQIMPVMFTAFMLFLPSGLVLYILVNTVMGVVQQYMMNNDLRFRDLAKGRFRIKAS
jgi:YidC/Oxa1 family membrane protein insertase